MAKSPTITVGIPKSSHKTLHRIAAQKGWPMRYAAAEAVKALEEKHQKATGVYLEFDKSVHVIGK